MLKKSTSSAHIYFEQKIRNITHFDDFKTSKLNIGRVKKVTVF